MKEKFPDATNSMNLGRFINIWGRDYISRDFGGGPETKPGLRIFPL